MHSSQPVNTQIHVSVQTDRWDDAQQWTSLAQDTRAGAVASFVGFVRNDPSQHLPLTSLSLEHYPGMTEKNLRQLAQVASARFELLAIRIIHRVGTLRPGEPIVLVLTCAAHRKAALQAVDFVMDHLKSTIPFWKREQHGDQHRWVEAKSSDEAALQQWLISDAHQ